jgi:hypothetical protein
MMSTLAAADLAEEPFHPQVWAGRTVPYITRWSEERDVSLPDLLLHRDGLRYKEEFNEDRDAYRGLWERTAGGYGDGEPEWVKVTSERQRTCMEHLLCQVCAGPASRTRQGVLFLERGRGRGESAADIEDTRTAKPPLCLRCARKAREECPQLRHRCVALRARKTPAWGVFGTAYVPRRRGVLPTDQLVFSEEAHVPYGTRDLPFVVAGQLLRELRRVTIVNLDEELRRSQQ